MPKKHLFSRLLKKAILMALWTKASLCGKSSLLKQSLPRTPSRPKTSIISVNPVILSNLSSCSSCLRGEKIREISVNPRLINDLRICKVLYICRETFTDVMSALQIRPFMQNKANFRKSQMNVNKVLTKVYEKRTLGQRGKNEPNTNPIYPVVASGEAGTKPICRGVASGEAGSNPISRAKNSCSRCLSLLQSFQENFDKPGERKAECSARPKLRTDPMNLLGTMPAKEGKIDLKHSFCGPR